MLKQDYLRDGAAIYERSFAIIRAEADLARFSRRGSGHRRAHDPCLRPGRMPPRRSNSRRAWLPPRAGRWLAARRSYATPRWWRTASPAPAFPPTTTWCAPCAIRPCRSLPPSSAPPARPPRSNCGATGWTARWWRSATRRPRCSVCWKCWRQAPHAPAAILGMPVGFVGAAESKEALAANPYGVPWLIVRGRMGGSAMTAAAVNALAREGL